MKQLKHSTGGGTPQKSLRRRTPSKPRLALFGLVACALALVGTIAALMSIPSTVLAAGQTADANTTGSWEGKFSSDNVGMVWTDKTVTANDGANAPDFTVTLSALSSTSNVTTTTTSNKPLDIVLVLDVSGSMNWGINEVYSSELDQKKTYYLGNSSAEVTYQSGSWGYVSGWNRRTITPTTSADDNSDNHTQLYETTRIDALQNAASQFAVAVAGLNDSIADPEQQHRISVVKFSGNLDDTIGNQMYTEDRNTWNYSQVVTDFSSYTTSSVSSLQATIEGLSANGGTRADNGMTQAQRVLNGEEGSLVGARKNAQQVVIFFTDGEPTETNNWSDAVAGSAINTAHSMKKSGALVYGIGVFEGANPGDTSGNFNRYMNAVSSNYPDAQCTNNTFTNLSLGSRAAASTEEEADPQYYFAASNATELNNVFDQIQESITTTTGSGSPIAEVISGESASAGELTFTDHLGAYMEVPASGPMTLTLNKDTYIGTTSDGGRTWTFESEGAVIVNAAYPTGDNLSKITVVVTKSDDLATGDTVTVKIPASLLSMINYNVAADGTITTEDAIPIQLSYGVSLKDDAETALNDSSSDGYASIVSAADADGDGTAEFYANSYSGDTANVTASFTPAEGNSYYRDSNGDLKEDLSSQNSSKGENPIGVDYVVSASAAEGVVTHRLGNNGKLSVELPATLAITKDLSVGTGIAESDYDATSFQMTIEVKGASGEYRAAVYKDGSMVGDEFTVTFENETAKHSIKNGETLYIYGLDGGAQYSVTETADQIPGGFTASYDSKVSGTLTAGATSSTTVTNTYAVEQVTLSNSIMVQKNLSGRNWNDGEQYTFVLTAAEGIPMPESDTVTVSDGNAVAFGDITYQTPGIYTYTITEQSPATTQPGMSYSSAVYNVVVTVSDDYDGTMSTSVVVTLVQDDAGNAVENAQAVAGNTAVFTNAFTESMAATSIQATKSYTDTTGEKNLVDGMFSVEIRPVGDNASSAPLPANEQTDENGRNVIVTNVGTAFTSGTMTFSNTMDGQTFTYQVSEVNDGVAGMKYDANVYTVEITVNVTGDNQVQLTTVYKDAEGNELKNEAGEAATPTFSNTYDPTDVTLSGATAIQGTKTLSGRSWAQNETFGFTLALKSGPENGATLPNDMTATASSDGAFNFGDITFSKPGTYVFTITETAHNEESLPSDGAAGMTYDRVSRTVTVVVKDSNEGELFVDSVTYDNGSISGSTNSAIFVNTYTASPVTFDPDGEYGVEVTKVVIGNGADEQMSPEGYSFTIAVSNVTDPKNPSSTGFNIANTNGVSDAYGKVAFDNIIFTAAGTYEITVSEVKADNANITYDGHKLVYTVNVTDNGTGNLEAAVVSGTVSDGEATFTNVYYDENDAKDVVSTNAGTTASIDGQMVGVGDTLTYTIDWVSNATDENGNPIPATVTVTDVIPANTQVVDGSISEGGQLSDDGSSITWTFESQPYGATGTVSFQVTVLDAAGGTTVANQATVASGSNSYTTNQVTNPVPGKSETTNPSEIEAGDTLTYNIAFTNTGGVDATATVVDTLTAGLEYANNYSVTVDGNPYNDVEFTLNGQTLTWIINNLPANAQVVVSFDATVTRAAGLEVQNSATVNGHASNVVTTPYPTDDKKDVVLTSDPTASINGQMVGVGDELTYTIDWAAGEAGAVSVTDVVPDGTAFVSAENGGTHDEATNTVTWNLGEQAEGARGTVSFTVEVTEDAVNVDAIENTASITVGNNDPKTTNKVTVDIPKKTVEDGTPETGIQVGDTLTYTVEYRNDTAAAATVTVTDTLPAGLTVDESTILNGGAYDEATRTITWTFNNLAAGESGTVAFSAVVNESATTVENPVTNQATVTVGNVEHKTNTTTGEVYTGNLTISKEIQLTEGQGTQIDTDKPFSFTVKLTDAAGNALTGTYSRVVAAGAAPEQITFDENGEATISLKHGESYEIAGLPEGAVAAVTEAAADGYTSDQATKTETVTTEGASIEFINTYSAEETTGVPANFSLTKVFNGHEWTKDYSFQFVLKPATEGAPMPQTDESAGVVYDENTNTATKTISGPQGIDSVTFDFGGISYSAAGTYEYTVTEVRGDNAGIKYSQNEATITVTVKDNGNGTLSASATVSNGTFTNTYDTGTVDIDSVANGGLAIVKNMTGRDIAAGDFTFTMTGNDDASIARLNNSQPLSFSTSGAALGNAGNSNSASELVSAITGLTFTKDDAGKTYTYTIAETIPAGAADNGNGTYTLNGVTYDAAEHTIAFEVIDGGTGTLTVKAYVDGASEPTMTYTGEATSTFAAVGPIIFTFNNSYDAGSVTVGGNDADVTLLGEKKLANRPMTAGEFTFNVTDADGNLVISGTNDANGTITFGNVTYTTEKLNSDVANGIATRTPGEGKAATYTYQYTVAEDQSSFVANGITAVTGSLQITVTVVDDGAGNLSASVTYPDNGTGMVFENIYGNGEDGSFTSNLSGSKVLKVESGDNAPDITGKYTFTVTVPEGAPAPERTTATNDASGNVDFGTIVFTMENVFGDTGDEVSQPEDGVATMSAQRTKTFTYTVTETGSVDGVTNDATASYDVTFTVTDNGDGTLSVTKSVSGGPDFTFTNTYSVDPKDSSLTGDGGFSVTKKLTSTNTGRTLTEGEFTFQLLDTDKNVVAEASNDAQGVVTLPALTFDAPGTYSYTLVEVTGSDAGVTYDTTPYEVTATVKDNSDGTLTVTWDIPKATDGAVTFENSYTADSTSVIFGATKTLTGRAMNEGEFTFELVDENGKVVQTATNDANGGVTFDSVPFDAEGAYQYTIREQLPEDDDPDLDGVQKKGVTYDQAEWTATVTVTDNTEKGVLEATVDFGDGVTVPSFTNTYAPSDPATIVFGATKTLTGRDIVAGEFTFELRDSSGTVVQTAKVAADGTVVFSDPVAFGSAGTYAYTIAELLPEDDDAKTAGVQSENVTYDETVHTATVTVTDNLDGTLSATVSYDGKGEFPIFENAYVAPPTMPQTGDSTNVVLPVVLGASGVALATSAIVLRRRRNR